MSFIRLTSSDINFRTVVPIKFSHNPTQFGNLMVSVFGITSTYVPLMTPVVIINKQKKFV
jgi:hypothetical protein